MSSFRHYERLIISELDEFDGVVAIVWDRSLIRRVNIVSLAHFSIARIEEI